MILFLEKAKIHNKKKRKMETANYRFIISFRHSVNREYIFFSNFFLYRIVTTFLKIWFFELLSQFQEICNETILDMNVSNNGVII